NGSGSCAAWLTWRVGLEPGAGRELVRVARALGTLPLLAQALARGELSYSKIRALTRVASPETEERLLAVARAGTAEHVERIVRGWRRVDRIAEARESTRRHRSRALHVYRDEDGMVVIRGRLAPEVGAALLQALAAARETLYQRAHAKHGDDVPAGTPGGDVPAETPTMAQQQADALALVAETALHHGIDPGTPGSGTKSWSTSMPRCWRTRTLRASRSSRTGHTFPRKRPGVWPATRLESSCNMTQTAISRRSVRGPAPFRLRYDVRFSTGTEAAASPAAHYRSVRAITFAIGPTEAPPRCRISRCCVAGITARCTKRDIRWSDRPME